MSGYSEYYREQQQRDYINKHVPLEEWAKLKKHLDEADGAESARFWLARARDAEAQLAEIRRAVSVLTGKF